VKDTAVSEDDKLFGWRADHPRLYYNDVAFAPKADLAAQIAGRKGLPHKVI